MRSIQRNVMRSWSVVRWGRAEGVLRKTAGAHQALQSPLLTLGMVPQPPPPPNAPIAPTSAQQQAALPHPDRAIVPTTELDWEQSPDSRVKAKVKRAAAAKQVTRRSQGQKESKIKMEAKKAAQHSTKNIAQTGASHAEAGP